MASDRDMKCLAIREKHIVREMAVRMQLRIENGVAAQARRLLGFQITLPEAEREKITKQAAKVVKYLFEGNDPEGCCDERLALALSPIVAAAQQSLPAWLKLANEAEQDMCTLAADIPAVSFVKDIRGFGITGFAQIVGEAGNLDNYATWSKLWKRMGLAVMPDGKPQRKSLDAEQALAMGYVPKRRSIMWRIGDSLIKGNKDGKYRKIYLARKLVEAGRTKTKMHAHRRAKRYMEKCLLKDLWRAWRGQARHENHCRSAAPLS